MIFYRYNSSLNVVGFVMLSGILLSACGTKNKVYSVASMTGSRELMTDKYDKNPDKEMVDFVSHYKVKFDQEMKVQIGTSDQKMTIGKPESLLTNFTSDQMKRFGDEYTKGNCDLAIMNVHGHRAGLPEGKITLENLYEVYPFSNKLIVLKLKGRDLLDVFAAYIEIGGAGISSNVRLVGIGKSLKSALVDGRNVDPDKIYSVLTIDYLGDGNDGMESLKKAVSEEKTGVTLRDMMIDYVKSQMQMGKAIHSQLDGRIIISKPA